MERPERACKRAEAERGEHAGNTRPRRGVQRHLDRRRGRDRLAVEALGPPERLVVHHRDLEDRSRRHALHEQRPVDGELRFVRQMARQGGRDRGDHPPGAHLDAVAAHDHTVAVLSYLTDRPLQQQRVAELGCDAVGHRLGASRDAVLLVAALDRQQVVQPVRRPDEIKDVQQRHLRGVAVEEATHGSGEQTLPFARRHRGRLDPLRGAAGVPGLRPTRRPGLLERHALRHRVEPRHPERQAGERDRIDGRDQAAEALHRVPPREDGLALVPRGIGRDAQLGCERIGVILSGAEPGAADVDGGAVGRGAGPDSARHAVARLEHDHRRARLLQASSGDEPGVAGSDHAHVGVHMRNLPASEARTARPRGARPCRGTAPASCSGLEHVAAANPALRHGAMGVGDLVKRHDCVDAGR